MESSAPVGSLERAGVGIFDDCQGCGHKFAFHPAGPQGEDGKKFGCRLTRVQLEEAGVGIFDDCQGCGHKFAFHPAGPQGEGRSSCHFNIAAVT
jgi:ribosomal protein L37AE/L43A